MSATNGQLWTQVFLKDNGTPYSGVRVFHYVAGGTTTSLDVYADGAMTTAAANPVVGDTKGRVSFYGSNTYRLLVKSSVADGDVTLYDFDPVELVHHTATVRAQDRGTSLPSAVSASRGRLFGVTDGGGDVTELWMQTTASVWREILSLPELSQMLQYNKGTDIASTTSVTIPTDGNFFDVTGTNSIESFSGFTGYPVIYTRTISALTFVHDGVDISLPGSANYTTIPNEIIAWMHVGAGGWVFLSSNKGGVSGALIPGYGLIADSTNRFTSKNILPIGVEMFWPTTTAPTHWIFGYGQALSRTTYASYFAVVGTTYGVGDGSTTFNAPDYRGRLPLVLDNLGGSAASRITSASTNGANATTIGGVGGAQTHTLAKTEIPPPVITLRGTEGAGGPGTARIQLPAPYGNESGLTDGGGNGQSTSAITTDFTSGAHSTMPPWIARAVIIYVGV